MDLLVWGLIYHRSLEAILLVASHSRIWLTTDSLSHQYFSAYCIARSLKCWSLMCSMKINRTVLSHHVALPVHPTYVSSNALSGKAKKFVHRDIPVKLKRNSFVHRILYSTKTGRVGLPILSFNQYNIDPYRGRGPKMTNNNHQHSYDAKEPLEPTTISIAETHASNATSWSTIPQITWHQQRTRNVFILWHQQNECLERFPPIDMYLQISWTTFE